MALLDDGAWQGKVWTGAWTDGSGGTYDVVEPATGHVVGAVGKATDQRLIGPGGYALALVYCFSTSSLLPTRRL